LQDARKVVPLGDHQADRPGKEEGAHVHEVEGLAGLKPGERLIEVLAIEDKVLATQRDLARRGLPQLVHGLSPRRQVLEERLDAEL